MTKRSSSARHTTGTDGAALLLRLTIGPMLVAHGYNKIFGPGGIEGTTRWFGALGLKPPHVHARLAAATEIGAGSLLTLGAASPLPAAAAIGLMTTAARTDHKGKGPFVFKGGWEYTAVIAGVAAVIAALGPGRYSVDRLLGQPRSGARWAVAAVAFGVANSAALLATSYRPAPPAEETSAVEADGNAEVLMAGGEPAAGGEPPAATEATSAEVVIAGGEPAAGGEPPAATEATSAEPVAD